MSEENTKSKIALVTGAGRGIGRPLAESLAEDGLQVICVSKSASSCGSAAESIQEKGGLAESLAVDVSSGEEIRKACEDILEKHGCVDVLVNNAGITRDNLLFRMEEDDWMDVINTNLNSCFHWVKALGRPMIRKRWGRIINISSVVGLTGNAGQANYAAAKAGMIGLTKSLAREFAARSVTVNAIAPGFIETDMTRPFAESQGKSASEMGMKTPEQGSSASVFLMMGEVPGSGMYFGSDCLRSPLDRYRSPGDPPYEGD